MLQAPLGGVFDVIGRLAGFRSNQTLDSRAATASVLGGVMNHPADQPQRSRRAIAETLVLVTRNRNPPH